MKFLLEKGCGGRRSGSIFPPCPECRRCESSQGRSFEILKYGPSETSFPAFSGPNFASRLAKFDEISISENIHKSFSLILCVLAYFIVGATPPRPIFCGGDRPHCPHGAAATVYKDRLQCKAFLFYTQRYTKGLMPRPEVYMVR